MPASRRAPRCRRSLFALLAVFVAALLAPTASFAFAPGPAYDLFARASKPAHATGHAAARKGAISRASRLTKTRTGTGKGRGGSTTPAPEPAPSEPAPTPPADTSAPETSIVAAPALITTATGASFSFAASEPGAAFECQLDGGAWAPCASPKSYSGLGLILHQFAVRATDAAGNVDPSPAIATWTVIALTPPPPADTTAPETSIASGPSGTTTATGASFAFSASETGSSFECRLDAGSWAPCASPSSYSGLGLGAHTFAVRATDAAGNTDASPASRSWSVEAPAPPADTTAPETAIASGPGATTTATTAAFAFSASESGASFACKLDSGSWRSCSSPKSYSGLATGSHSFAVRATDAAGNTDGSPASRSWTVEAPAPPADTTAPETAIASGPGATTTATEASFAFSASESGASFECSLDSGSWNGCATPKSYSGLATGAHTFAVRATDAAGNTDPSPATYGWSVEAPAPPPPPAEPPSDECTSTVASVSAAQSGVSAAAPGAVLCLADGSYAKLTLSATKAAPGVTLRAQNPGRATIAGASLAGSNITLARFVSTSSISVQPGASGMTIEHNRVTGGGQGIDAGPTSTTTINDTKIIGNELIGPFGEDAIHLNRYHDANGDGVGILIEGNEITNVRENGNHSDCLQTVWVGDHLVFRRNYLHDNRCQGFFVKDQASLGGVSGPINGITVENNLFVRNKEPCGAPLSSCGQPMYFQVFGPYTGFTMRRNTIWGDGMDSIAAFRESTGSDTLIADNVIYRLWTDTNMSTAELTDNTICKRETGSGGSWEATRSGETSACSLSFGNAGADDYRLSGGGRGVDWAPAAQHFGP